MILCFGTFVRTLSCCTKCLPQVKFVPKVAWVVDRCNSSLASGLDYVVDDPDGMEGNKAVVSRLLSCERPLVLNDKQLPSLAVARERFKSKVMPFINDDKVAEVTLAILYIIFQDKTIGIERKESFKKHLGMYKDELLRQTKFNVPDFFTRVLLYTTCVDNGEGKPFVENITDTFIEKIANESWADLKWDIATQTVEIIPSEAEKFWDEINTINDLRLSLMASQENCANTSWLGIDGQTLFPCRYKPIEFKDPSTKRIVTNKLLQYMKLVHEFISCLSTEQQLPQTRTTEWPIFPGERTLAIRQQLQALSDELLVAGIFSERLKPE